MQALKSAPGRLLRQFDLYLFSYPPPKSHLILQPFLGLVWGGGGYRSHELDFQLLHDRRRTSFDGIVMRSSKTRRVRERPMRNAAGEEMTVPLRATIAFDDPKAMCQAAVLGMGVTQIVMARALRHLESGALVRLVPQWYADAGPISIYYASRRLVPAKTRVFVDFVAEAFRRQRLEITSR
jgi:DNA-binding transcriptional LysR family regulator